MGFQLHNFSGGAGMSDILKTPFAGLTQEQMRELASLRDWDACERLAAPRCSFDGCLNPLHARGFCRPHYRQVLESGRVVPLRSRAAQGLAASWFAYHAGRAKPDQCLIWPFGHTGAGYPSDGSKAMHVAACEISNGPKPHADALALHACGDRSCVNPAHLRWGHAQENSDDRIFHGTYLGLDPATVVAIFLASGKQTAIADDFGVAQSVVSRIRSGRSYSALTSKLPMVRPA